MCHWSVKGDTYMGKFSTCPSVVSFPYLYSWKGWTLILRTIVATLLRKASGMYVCICIVKCMLSTYLRSSLAVGVALTPLVTTTWTVGTSGTQCGVYNTYTVRT